MSHQYDQSHLNHLVQAAIVNIQCKHYIQAKQQLCEAMFVNDHTPVIHNLLGIICELHGDNSMAMRHYRCSYVLDGTYRPAISNLIRCSEQKSNDYDFGIGSLTFEQRKMERSGKK